jgi:hypothetical protein
LTLPALRIAVKPYREKTYKNIWRLIATLAGANVSIVMVPYPLIIWIDTLTMIVRSMSYLALMIVGTPLNVLICKTTEIQYAPKS